MRFFKELVESLQKAGRELPKSGGEIVESWRRDSGEMTESWRRAGGELAESWRRAGRELTVKFQGELAEN